MKSPYFFRIINFTQHAATPEQMAAGVCEPANKAAVKELLTFDKLPSSAGELVRRAQELAELAVNEVGSSPRVMIGGAPFFMAPLELALRARGIIPVYAFSKREAADVPHPDGSVLKTQVFRHAGFVEVEL